MVINVHNGLITDLSDTMKDTINGRIEDTEALIGKVKDKSTYEFLLVLIGIIYDYEQVSKFVLADNVAKEALDILFSGKLNLGTKDMNTYVLSCYDTRARCGDFESFLLAMEWKRPLEKQFYIPRRKILKKFGLIQALQDVADGKLDFLCINMPP